MSNMGNTNEYEITEMIYIFGTLECENNEQDYYLTLIEKQQIRQIHRKVI